MENRMTRDQLFFDMVGLIAQRGTCERGKVGCVIAQGGRTIMTGYNGPPTGNKHCHKELCDTNKPCTRAIHAEANAIAYAARKGIALEGTTLYCYTCPCQKCSELIIQSGITEVVYYQAYRNEDGLNLMLANNITCRTFILS